jgi:catechol 2,3-dioxygenase-like lactoylglutathione lyase family enzyme
MSPRHTRIIVLALLLLTVPLAQAQTRPKITGISHGGYFVSDLPAALRFWHDLLGFDVPYTLPKPGSTDTRIAFVKINDHQHIELFTDPPPSPPRHLSHIAFSTDNAEAMRLYLRAQGIQTPAAVGTTRAGDFAFEVKDPDNNLVEFVQMLPAGREAQAAGKSLPPTRISAAIYHLGFLVGNSQRSLDFYGRILGFQETWRGSPRTDQLSWINMRVPDGTDYVEFMLYAGPPTDFGGKNHVSLVVPDINKAVETLKSRPAFAAYTRPVEIHTGINQKRQVNLFDPDGTRVELMEPNTLTGKPTPPSTAPPPPPAHP